VLAVVLTCVALVLIAGLAFYAMYRSKPSRLKLSATLLKLASFSIEVESQDERPGRQVAAGQDTPASQGKSGQSQDQ
jgi:hypothetical protein